MKLICVPGKNGLGMTEGVENSYKEVLKGFEYELLKINLEDIESGLNEIYSKSFSYLSREKCLFFGGDHSISFPLVKAFFDINKFNSKLLVFDAHPDLMEPMQEPTHEEWLRGILNEGFRKENVLIVGVRRNSENVDKKEISFAKKNKIKIIYSDEFEERKLEILDFVSSGKVYLSLDIDVFDSSIISSTGYPEKEGLSEEQVFSVLSKIRDKIVSCDLVEVNLEKGKKKENLKAISVSRKLLKTFQN